MIDNLFDSRRPRPNDAPLSLTAGATNIAFAPALPAGDHAAMEKR